VLYCLCYKFFKSLIYLRFLSFLSSSDMKLDLLSFVSKTRHESREDGVLTDNGLCILSCFKYCVKRYYGDYKNRGLTCWKQFLCMAFDSLTLVKAYPTRFCVFNCIKTNSIIWVWVSRTVNLRYHWSMKALTAGSSKTLL
jgi:hypothetical protein